MVELLTFSTRFAHQLLQYAGEDPRTFLAEAAGRLLLLAHYTAYVAEVGEEEVINLAILGGSDPEGEA